MEAIQLVRRPERISLVQIMLGPSSREAVPQTTVLILARPRPSRQPPQKRNCYPSNTTIPDPSGWKLTRKAPSVCCQPGGSSSTPRPRAASFWKATQQIYAQNRDSNLLKVDAQPPSGRCAGQDGRIRTPWGRESRGIRGRVGGIRRHVMVDSQASRVGFAGAHSCMSTLAARRIIDFTMYEYGQPTEHPYVYRVLFSTLSCRPHPELSVLDCYGQFRLR